MGTLSAAGGVSYLSSACTMQNPFVIRARMSAYDNLRCGRGDPLFNATFLVAPLISDPLVCASSSVLELSIGGVVNRWMQCDWLTDNRAVS